MDIAILIYDGITALDAVGPYEVLSCLPKAEIHFVAKEIGPVRTHTRALSLVADYKLSDVQQPEIIIVPGGTKATLIASADEEILNWIRAAHESSKWTISVCTGALILGAAGILKGLLATTHWFAREHLTQFGAEYSNKRIVQQGKVITAAGVSAGIDMALHLVSQIAGKDVAEMIQLLIEYDPRPPFDSGSIQKASKEIIKLAEKAAELEFKS